VKLVGTFNNWKEQLLMEKDSVENVFKYNLKLKRDKYEYKFIVDNFWNFRDNKVWKETEKKIQITLLI